MFRVFQNRNIGKSIFILSMIIMVCAFSGCNKGSDNESNKDAGSNTPAQQQGEKELLQIGEAGQTDTFEITVTDVQKPDSWVKSLADGREYVIVAIKVKNISQAEESIGVSDFQYVVDDDGDRESYENYSGVKTDPDTFGAASIAPGDTFEGSIVYSMPIDMNQIELHYIKGYTLEPDLAFVFNK